MSNGTTTMIYHCHIERAGLQALIDLKGEPGDVCARLQSLSLEDPPPRQAASAADLRVCRVAPWHWLLRAPLDQEDSLLERLIDPALPPDTLIVPVSDVYAWFTVHGPEARELLSVGCPLDLDASAFAANGATFTELFSLKALLWRDADGFELAVERSYAPLVTDWFERIQGGG